MLSTAPPPAGNPWPALVQLDPAELQHRRETATRIVQDDGIVVDSDPEGRPTYLRIDPLPLVLTGAEWAELEAGLAQRARLLDALLADLYGPRTVLDAGLLPAELVMGHPGFLPQADGVATRHRLFLTAVDLGRRADGSWCVLGDRTQSPVGAGYAMAIRRVTARALASLHRETDLRRLRGFFDAMRTGLQDMGTSRDELPRVVLLAGQEPSEATFDEAFTATILGYPLVHGEDLVTRDGRMYLTTTEHDEPVDVIVRRVPAACSDPLDLAPASRIGVPGMVEATRSNQVSVINPVGAGVLENPALSAFLPGIAHHLLSEELLLPSAQTWWCGDASAREHVRAHLDELLVAPISPRPDAPRTFVAELDEHERAALLARIELEPWAWCAQEVLPMWQAPVVTDDGLASRTGVLRTFTLADERGVTVLPGGLARLAQAAEDRHVPHLRDAIVKDVWVLDDAPRGARDETGADLELGSAPRHVPVPLPPRAAEDLYWFGRYAERAESTARLLLVADDLVEDHVHRPGTVGFEAMSVIIDAIDQVTAVQRDRGPRRPDKLDVPDALPNDPLPHLRTLLFDADRRGTVRYSARRAANAAGQVRELLSGDTWLVLSRLDRALGDKTAADELPSVLGRVLESFLALAGMAGEGLVRDVSWAFHDAGRRVERSQETVRILRRTVATSRPRRVDRLVFEAVLRSRDSLISQRRRLADGRTQLSPQHVALDLLLVDPTNPRSVVFQLNQLREALTQAPSTDVELALDAAARLLTHADLGAAVQGDRHQLATLLADVETALRQLSATIDAAHFRHRARQQQYEEPR